MFYRMHVCKIGAPFVSVGAALLLLNFLDD